MEMRYNILLIEDNPGDVMLMEEILADSNRFRFNISHAETLRIGLEILQQNDIDIVLLDLGLPDNQGLDAIGKIHKKYGRVPIVVITGLDDEETGQKAINKGAQSYVVKGMMNQRAITDAIAFALERNKILQEVISKEKALQTANDLLKIANSEKERLIALVSHDLRGPIKTIVSFLELLRQNYDDYDDAKRKKIIDSCISSGKSTVELMETLLEWARAQANENRVKPKAINLQEMLRNTLDPLIETAVNKNVSIQQNVSEEIVIYADPDMVATVFRNLVSNAIKFTPSGGKVTISAEPIHDQSVHICVSDTGVGIDENDLDKLFDITEGYTTPGTNNEKGSGFGLILCKEFIEKNKGSLKIVSQQGKGTKVFIVLPETM